MDFIENSKFAKDIMFLHDKLEINLIGRYHRNKQPFRHIQKTFVKNNKKEISYFENINLTDDLGLSSIYLSKGAYYDNKKFILPPVVPNLNVIFNLLISVNNLSFYTFSEQKN